MRDTVSPSLSYQRIFDSFGQGEQFLLARIKRFLEVWAGDRHFRDELVAALAAGKSLKQVCSVHGISSEVDPYDLLQVIGLDGRADPAEQVTGPGVQTVLWRRYISEMLLHRSLIRRIGGTADGNPRFNSWRNRQIRRCDSELGQAAQAIVHPVIAFELSEGCSVGCWFCGISASKFRGYFPYEPNRDLWRGVLQSTINFFGPAAATGFCYWGTDPIDNPDYARFIEDYYHATGWLPQTTTAIPLKNIDLTKQILQLHRRYRTVTNRFSVLNLKYMRRIHQVFTEDELLGVELVLQNDDSIFQKAASGRARARVLAQSTGVKDHSTIACVTGFLVNMPHRRIQLVTPTQSTEAWPNGYWILGERSFQDPESFLSSLWELADRHMIQEIEPNDVIAIRQDLRMELRDDGFELAGAVDLRKVTGVSAKRFGEILAKGPVRAGELHAKLARFGENPFEVAQVMDDVFEAGLLNEDPRRVGIHSVGRIGGLVT